MKTQRTKDMERLSIALELCMTLHSGQTDKCGQPYWIHPFTVGMFSFNGFSHIDSISYAIVGVLHDVLEDTAITMDRLVSYIKLTDKEIEALQLLTREDGTSYDDYIDRIVESGNETAMVVKMNDLMHNGSLKRFVEAGIPVTEKDEARRDKYRKAFDKIHKKLNEE